MFKNTEVILREYIDTLPINNTHCHNFTSEEMRGLNLFEVLRSGYIFWMVHDWEKDSPDGRKRFFEKYSNNSYAYWLFKGLEDLYPVGAPLSVETWDTYDTLIRQAYQDPSHNLKVLRENCRYKNIILEKYHNPGWDNGVPDLFRPALRCDCFFNGYDHEVHEHDGIRAYAYDAFPFVDTLKEYIQSMGEYIGKCKAGQVPGRKAIALKIGIAYERDLYFENSCEEKAAKAFLNPNPSAQEIRDFQDYIMYKLLDFASDYNLPVQIHTGLATLKNTNAMQLCHLIAKHPEIKFDLFHGSFPWTDDILALAHNYDNVYADLCWLPLISPTRAISFIKEIVEVADSHRILWGCDTWTCEESYSAVLAGRFTLSRALSQMIEDGFMNIDQAKHLLENIFYNNAQSVFQF